MFQQILVNGLVLGGIYAMLALGFALVFGVARIINLAHTAFYMLAAYGLYFFVSRLGLNMWLAIPVVIILVSLVGVASYLLFIKPVSEHEDAMLIVTIALAIVIQEAMLIGFGGSYRSVPTVAKGFTEVLGVRAGNQELVTLGVGVAVLVGVWFFLMRTRWGLAVRAAAQDREVANLMGIDVNRAATLTILIGMGMAALAGAAVAPLATVTPLMWNYPLIIVLASVILGGLGSLVGALVGAFVLAFSEVMVVSLVPNGSYLRTAVALAIMVVVLLVKPSGLFGVDVEAER